MSNNAPTLLSLIDHAQRELELATFAYYALKVQEAETHGSQSIKLFNQILKLYSGSNGPGIQKDISISTIKQLCNLAIEIYTKIKKVGKPTAEKVPMETSLKWLSSQINQDFFLPLITNDYRFFVDPLDLEFSDKMENLSAEQAKYFDRWGHASQLDVKNSWELNDLSIKDLNNLYQDDLTSTCSFVSSLLSIVNNDPLLIYNLIYPRSKSFKYLVQLQINGCKRAVIINDKLPFSKDRSSSKSLFLRSSKNQHLYWPALLEKSYFKVIGNNSYKFNGSNAGYDTYLLTGWIPEYIKPLDYCQHEDTFESFWNMLYDNFRKRKCLISLGTESTDSRVN